MPLATLEVLSVPVEYLLLRRLVRPAVAWVAALLWATSPYLIAHSRLLHLDALLTTFMTLSVLLLLVATTEEDRGSKIEDRANVDPRSSILDPRSSGRWLGRGCAPGWRC